MFDFITEIKQLFESAKSAPARTRTNFTIPKANGTPFVERQHYMQILINEMYLAHERRWWVEYSPVALVATTYLYGNDYQTAPIVIGPNLFKQYSNDVGDGVIIRNAPVTSLHPYQGGPVTPTVLFSKVERQDNSDKVLDVLEGFAEVANPIMPALPFTSYLKIAGSVMAGLRTLINLPRTQPILAYRDTINPDIKQKLAPVHLVLIDTPTLSDAEKKRFRVKDSQLYYGDSDQSSTPYRDNDFILLEIAQGDKRTDERTLSFYPLWQETRKLGLEAAKQDGFWQEAKNHFNTLKVAITESADLTESDIKRLRTEYLNEMKAIRQGHAEDALLRSGELAGTKEPDKAMLGVYQQIAKELDQLDEL
jgi:hypothetical protein